MKIHRNPFLDHRMSSRTFRSYFGRGVETLGFARDEYYKEAKTFRLGPIEIVFKYKLKPWEDRPKFNHDGHYGKPIKGDN